MYFIYRDRLTNRIRRLCSPGLLSLIIIFGIASANERGYIMNKIKYTEDGCIEILLTQGKSCVIDRESYNKIKMYQWSALLFSIKYWYAVANSKTINGKRDLLRMHRLIMDAPKNKLCDHENSDTLDNRKSNLRVCTRAENNRNSIMPINNKSGYKGVHWSRIEKKWVAQISYNNNKISLGRFDNPKDAHETYKKAALKYHGEFAKLE